jgi:hypothetical protein
MRDKKQFELGQEAFTSGEALVGSSASELNDGYWSYVEGYLFASAQNNRKFPINFRSVLEIDHFGTNVAIRLSSALRYALWLLLDEYGLAATMDFTGFSKPVIYSFLNGKREMSLPNAEILMRVVGMRLIL